MISKRYRRSSQPQENLKQFSLNSSRGVDETKPVTDPSTVLDMQNLTVNDDGSLSLRKRMLAAYPVSTSGGEKVHLMHTGEHVLVCDATHGIRIFPKGSDTECTYNVKGTTYYSRVEVTANTTIDDFSSQWNVSAATFLNTSDSTILGNVYVSDNLLNTIGITTYPVETLIDLNLLPSASARPRYLKITESDTENIDFDILIVTPEINTLTTSEGSVSLNPNMTLDNPYAIRDVYGSELVQVTGIIPYVDADSGEVFFSKSADSTTKYFKRSFLGDLDPDNPVWYSPIVDNVVEDLYFADVSSNFGNFYSFVIAPSIAVTLRVYLKGTLAYLQYKASAPVPDGVLGAGLTVFLTIGLADIYEELNSVYNFRVFPTNTANGKPIPVSSSTIPVTLDLSRGSGEVVLKFNNTGSAPTNLKEALKIYADNFELSESARASLRLCVIDVYTSVTTYPINAQSETSVKVSAVTENGKPDGYRGVTVLDPTYASKTLLKAFCKLPKTSEYYCKWEYSLDGVNWNVYGDLPTLTDSITVMVPSDSNPSIYSEVHVVSKLTRKNEITGTPIPPSPIDLINYRPDVLPLQAVIETVGNAANASDMLYRFKIFSIDGMVPVAPYDIHVWVVNNNAQLVINNIIVNVNVNVNSTVTVNESGYVVVDGTVTSEYVGDYKRDGVQGKIGTIVASFETRIPTGSNMEYLETDMPNAVLGEKLYYKKAMYSYGTSVYDTFAYASDAGSFITPLYNILELDANAQDTVCAIIPWRNYLITCTEKSIYLSSKSENGFYTKTISTSVGIPFADRYCVKAALNGLILKSGYSIYFAYPNIYASDDTTLSLTDISKPIAHILDEVLDPTYECFAEVVNDLYVLMIPKQDSTACLCYNLNTRLWEYYTYPVSFSKFIKDPSIGTVVVSTRSGMVYNIFDGDYARIDPSKNNLLPERYGDIVNFDTVTSPEDNVTSYIATPIVYCWDTGQKTDSIAHTKQFVESKLVFATLSDRDAFPFTMYVAIDGDPHVTVQDVSTDAPFWKPTDPGVGVAGTGFKLSYNDDSPIHSNFNVLRQYVVRYSGKGKSIRHRIEGESLCNFKLYETYARYKNLNIKQ